MAAHQQRVRRRIDVFAVLLAIFILGLGVWLSTFPAETVRNVGIVLMAASVIGLAAWFAWGRVTAATWTQDGAVSYGKTRAALGIILLCALFSGGYVASHWPTGFLRSETQPSPQKSSELSPQLLSRLDHFILSCTVPPPPPGKTLTDALWDLQDYKAKLDVIGDTIGVTFTMVTIRGGIRIEGEAITDEAKRRIWSLSAIGVTKMTLEVRRIDNTLLVSVFVKLPPQFGFYNFITPNPAAPDSLLVVYNVERILGIKQGTCQIV